MSAELKDIIASLTRGDWGVWKKITALDGSGFSLVCCCNSEKCQLIKVKQTSGRGAVVMDEMDPPAAHQMPTEIRAILEVCANNATLKAQVKAYNKSRFDLTFICKGRGLLNWIIADS